MGNKQSIRIGLKLDSQDFEAGQVLEGKVYLSVSKQSQLDAVQGIHLQLEGWEQTVIRKHDHEQRRQDRRRHTRNLSVSSTDSSSSVATATNTLVCIDYPIVKASDIQIGQYEYVFRWRLPADLVTSMRCQKRDHSTSFCEVRYTLTAYLALSKSAPPRDALPQSVTTLNIFAKPPDNLSRQPIIAELEEYPVNTCLIWNKGKLCMGWQADTNVTAPRDALSVHVFGNNRSRNAVQYFSVKCVETVKWKATNTASSPSKVVTRTLCERRISVDGMAEWAATVGTTTTTMAATNGDDPDEYQSMNTASSELQAQLIIPKDARDSYAGRLVTVRHMLVVTAHTSGWATTSPESTFEIKMVRRVMPAAAASAAPSSLAPAQPSFKTPAAAADSNAIPEAHAVYTEDESSGPIVQDPVAIPMAQAVLLDDELQAEQIRQQATPFGGLAPSAPHESLDTGRARDQSSSIATSSFSDYIQPDVQQLETLVRESPASLGVLLDDPAWRTLVQYLTPRDYCRLCQAAPEEEIVSVARDLAICMDSKLECRHLLACLWMLPESLRCELLTNVGPLASDLDANRSAIEQELSPRELDVFRTALRAYSS